MKQKDLFLIAGFTFLTVLFWIVLSIYHAQVTSTITPSFQKKIEPIEPQFDRKVINETKTQRKSVSILPETLPATKSALPTLKPSPVASPSPKASPSANL